MGNISNLAEAREARRLQKPRTNGGKGFALLHRKIMDVPFYKDAEAAHLWVHLLLRANHEQTMVSTDVGDVICERGEFITGRNTLAMETGLTADRVKSLLRKFQNLGMITTKSNNRFTVLKVVKYDEYQSNFCPADVQPVSSANAVVPMPVEVECPADVQPVSTDNNILNNSLTNVRECASAAEKPEQKKPSLSCEQVVEVYHRVLPEAQSIRILTDKRRALIRTFWQKAGRVTQQLDGHKFTLSDWESYLSYIATNCRWMLENRPDQRTGRTSRRKALEYFLNVDVYAKTREGACDDL
ncbi:MULTISPECIES: DNA replication protein [Enterobacter cloacae complex]|uniref:DNA replication protein n=1 Tax=Enterobacter cloacae complex TaxID=354276 RepID=UPI0012513C98|nr:DNA replication protein [Enterobacter hormaechei]MCU3241116.1 DNA replication protein [Enterobacter hormaechei subsp. steigerwaltii]MBJ6444130.1 DNA replication protein [Enterobacter hormaechei]MBK4265184.1 DNA replication protein [Enterobacter hormaechei]MBT1527470.1 DNA replication protein [Enterobacter hormaechei subsp. xiangfangensis]MBT1816716.1 DNA replication protein [Enterobacter hormaechei subsp. xiangfangensis]